MDEGQVEVSHQQAEKEAMIAIVVLAVLLLLAALEWMIVTMSTYDYSYWVTKSTFFPMAPLHVYVVVVNDVVVDELEVVIGVVMVGGRQIGIVYPRDAFSDEISPQRWI